MSKYFGRSSPAIISFCDVIRRSGELVWIGTKATCGTSSVVFSSEHGEIHSVKKRKKKNVVKNGKCIKKIFINGMDFEAYIWWFRYIYTTVRGDFVHFFLLENKIFTRSHKEYKEKKIYFLFIYSCWLYPDKENSFSFFLRIKSTNRRK